MMEFFFNSDLSPLLIWGLPGLQCLWQAGLRFIWWQRVQHMAHTLALSIFFLLLGFGFIAASLISSEHAIMDFRWILPGALVAWLMMQVTLLSANILLARKLRRIDG